MGLGMRMATDLVVATLVGVGMGHYLDQWLGTQPWMTVLFFLFGAAAGFRAVYRAANGDPSR
ncbi:MAG: AtpZ/AtpI family protein [Magnetococcales bacterium]|nr:AtpZ/AtpI family protein [Magnetococcales bacterium]